MRVERVNSRPAPGPEPAVVTANITLASDNMAIRDGLRDLFAGPPLCDMSEECRGTAEIVFAEALNNIVEHAYAHYGGEITISVRLEAPHVHCRIVDTGLPMPGENLPNGALKSIDDFEDLPEGGFGWFLIRSLAQDLAYQRRDNRNHLSFWLYAN